MSLGYDQIMQLRLAVSEVFELVSRRNPHKTAHADGETAGADGIDLECSFVICPDKLEVLITASAHASVEYPGAEDEESLALLNSLMNVVEIDPETSLVRLVQYRAGSRA